ncbi:MAG TPA: serine hydrolase domain-containing protein [Caulobacteraceae bacterium]|nr:serine hydrolase domain-containing protein [Caulobacteraceae bacterium]
MTTIDTAAAPIEGLLPERFAGVRAAFARNFAERDDIGASFAAFVDGEPLIDIWGGWQDIERTRPWARDTIVTTYSSTKTALALCALWLADGHGLDLDAPVRRYWPEFAAAEVTTRQCLAHTAGLPGWDEPISQWDIFDYDKCVGLLANQQPWWKPGTEWHYHAITEGFLVGEVIRRIDGRTMGQVLDQEFARPLGADYHVGTGPQFDDRVAPIYPSPPTEPPPPGSIEARTVANPVFTLNIGMEIGWRRCEIPAGNGFGNARALAQLMSVLACKGEVGGRRYLSAEGALRAAEESWRGGDPSIGGVESAWGVGFALNLGPLKFGDGLSCFWGGAGGSLVVVDFDRRLAFAYVMNKLKGAPFGDPRNMSLVKALYAAL